ncbi:MAG: Rrf2 family transcriptional regulator [candidate division Zixibacteria bacterium]|nr:Rrf2 family transcriptional regulator [candidate division Zixibacteria bacterium]
MKFSTRARYGLRMMVELARCLEKEPLVNLKQIAKITKISDNYLAQLAISLKNHGLVLGISGKKGGYRLARPANEITIGEVIQAVSGPLTITECVNHPDICLNSSFCEARAIWVLINDSVVQVMNRYSLAQLINKNWLSDIKQRHTEIQLLNPDVVMAENSDEYLLGCPGYTAEN